METIAMIAPIIAIGSGIASAGLGVVQGIQTSRAAKLEQSQHEDEARSARLAADQEENVRRKQLYSVLATNEALRGSRGLAMGTGTDLALRDSNISEAEDDIATGRMNRLGQARKSDLAAWGAGQRGGLLSGAGAVVSGLGTVASTAMRYRPVKA